MGVKSLKEACVSTRPGKKPQNGGPRTPAGKLRASKNARKHSLFAAELVFSEEERREFERLRCDLSRELMPTSAVLDVLFEDALVSAWRMKLALRCEQAAVRKELEIQDEENRNTRVDDGSRTTYSNSSSILGQRQRLKLLEELRYNIEEHGHIPAGLEKPVTEAFDADYWKMLVEWTPTTEPLRQLMESVIQKSELFGWELPAGLTGAQDKGKHFLCDPSWLKEMMLKLVKLKKQDILCALQYAEETNGCGTWSNGANGRLELCIRYRTTARRDFYRALKEYETRKRGSIS